MPFRVNTRLCNTCIFSSRSIITPERFAELRAQWAAESAVQQCHHSTIHGGTLGCRGHYEAAKRGDIPRPALDIMASIGITGQPADVFEIAERLGYITFEDADAPPMVYIPGEGMCRLASIEIIESERDWSDIPF